MKKPQRGAKRHRDEAAGWERTLDAMLANPKLPLRKRGIQDGHLPNLVNMVATTSLMPPGSKLPLETIATHLGPCSQYAPQQFAANIMKLGDSTGLLFSSGKLLLTAALTNMEVLYASHYFRLCVESVPYRVEPWLAPQGGQKAYTIETIFHNLSIHNIVGHGHFHFTVDLEALRDSHPDSIEWVRDNFPAARCKVWVYEDQRCHCGFVGGAGGAMGADLPAGALNGVFGTLAAKHLKRKCRCIIKCLVFANGSIVMIGGKATENVNYVFFHMKQLCRAPGSRTGGAQPPPLLLKLPGIAEEKRREKPKEYISESTAIALALVAAHEYKDKTRIKAVGPFGPKGATTILMHLAEAGRLEAVRFTLAIQPEQLWERDEAGKTVVQRLQQLGTHRTPQQSAVLDFIQRLPAQ